MVLCERVSQLAEQRIPNPQVGGSSPSARAWCRFCVVGLADWFGLTVVGRHMSSKSAGASLVPELFRFGVYKSSQGRMVRQFTFFAIVVIAAFGCLTLANGMLGTSVKAVRIGVPALMWLGCSWVAFRAVNIPKFADFLVSVESELEKVAWPSRHEVVQATIVVLLAMFSLGMFLFLIDLVWTWLFSVIGFTEYKS